ncbi:MAG TPA: SDR family NAD(P)-dependent oxidoreductase, partial [Fimbriimonas sp.]
MERLLEGKVAIVTGGGRGIGADICRVLSENGCRVVVNYSRAEAEAMGVASETGGIAVRADVRAQGQVQEMVDRTLKEFGKIDGVVNNAIGGRQHGLLEEMFDQDYQDMFEFSTKAVLNTVRAVRPTMRENGGGRIVNVVTELWNLAPGGWSVYLSGKGAMVGISRSLANELGPEGITVNMVAPGWMVTETVDASSEVSRKFGESLPLRHHGSA